MATFHIIGAGLAGLSAAASLSGHGHRICVYESTSQAGGRCRSFKDPIINREVDNGNHLLIGANRYSWQYVDRIGSRASFLCPHEYLEFLHLSNGKRTRITPPLWLPRAPLTDYLALMRMRWARSHRTVQALFSANRNGYRHFVEPFCVSALNTHPQEASAALFARTLHQSLSQKGKFTPYVPRQSWQHALIDPATTLLQKEGATFYYQHALKKLVNDHARITELHFPRTTVTVAAGDTVILATTAAIAAELCPELSIPQSYSPILNGHFVCDHDYPAGTLLGLIGGMINWIFFKEGLISTTTSAADAYSDINQDILATMLWDELSQALGIQQPLPDYRIVFEKRATFRATPESEALRPRPITRYHNVFLAGDYVQTGLPACIEGAIASGNTAATLAISSISH